MSITNHKKMFVVIGPTATFKTKTAIDIASFLKEKTNTSCEIINFDSLVFYKELSIGTAKPSSIEQGMVAHHMIDVASITSPITANDFASEANTIANNLHQTNRVPICVGGSGFYIRAMIKGMFETPKTSPDVQKKIEENFNLYGIEFFREILKENDFLSYQNLHCNDHYRIMRAVEFFWLTGRPISKEKENAKNNNANDLTTNDICGRENILIYLDLPKDEHLKIIDQRTKKMIDDGLITEVEGLLKKGFTKTLRPLQSIGYKESIMFLEGIIKSKEELIERINISTRQLAKSQRTWFNKVLNKHTFHPIKEHDLILQKCLELF